MKLAGSPGHVSVSERERQRINAALERYEGLVFTTAQLILRTGVELDVEDVQQLLRVKVWKGVQAFDPVKAKGLTQDRYIFMVVRDQAKDLVKKKRRGDLMIEDIAPTNQQMGGEDPRDKFDERYLSINHDAVFAAVEEEFPTLPNTLSERERTVLLYMYRDYRQTEIAVMLEITKREVESAVRAIRTKLADWRPSAPDKQPTSIPV